MTQERDIKELAAVAKNVTKLREERGWSKSKLAREAGLAASYISNLEGGKVPNPSLQALDAIASALGVSLPELFVGAGDSHGEARLHSLWDGLDERHREMTVELMTAWRLKQLVEGRSALDGSLHPFPSGDERRQVA